MSKKKSSKNVSGFLFKNSNQVLLCLIITSLFISNVSYGQVIESFTQRSSIYTPNQNIYHIKGDYTLIGNTNLTLTSYSNTTANNSNSMQFVDIDGDSATVNSSSAKLTFSTENDANPNCSEIIYAGLYWSGRANTGAGGSNAVTIGGTATNYAYNANGTNIGTYRLFITSTGSGASNITYYSFCPTNGSDTVVFAFTGGTGSTYILTVKVGRNTPSVVAASFPSNNAVNNNSSRTATLTSPYSISNGITTLVINSLQKNTSSILSTSYLANASIPAKILYKNQVKLKHETGTYQTLTANANDILYPTSNNAYIYVGYTEITDYVKKYGLGYYYVADMALVEGLSDGTGYYGGWGMVIIYQNDKMNWRDVTIFDGYAYVSSTSVAVPVSGFHAVQHGAVNLKLGVMAGEGDVSITGDQLEIQRLNQTGNYVALNHGGNSPTNFFNSSIYTGGNSRNPQLANNTGIDISMFSIPNSGNSIIANNQTSTTFMFTSAGDIYVPFFLAMAIDAYVPEVEAFLSVVETQTTVYDPDINGYSIMPNDSLELLIEVRNRGTETVLNASIEVDIPYNASYISHSAEYSSPQINGTLLFDALSGAAGSAIWNLNKIPAGYPDSVYAILKIKLKITDDCSIIASSAPNCLLGLDIQGNISGTTAINLVDFTNNSFVTGYNTEGACSGLPITTPINITINKNEYLQQGQCAGNYGNRTIQFCNIAGGTLPFTAISPYFPAGTRFYSAYPTAGATEYTIALGFPIPVNGLLSLYAVYPYSTTTACYSTLTIKNNTANISAPTINLPGNNITYCIGAQASPLSNYVTLSDTGNTLYFYNSPGGVAQLDITPSTAQAGTTNYFVYQGNGTCTSQNYSIFTVTVNSPVSFNLSTASKNICYGTPVNITATPPGGTFSYSNSFLPYITQNQNILTLSGNAPEGDYTISYTAAANITGCSDSSKTQSITIHVDGTTIPGSIAPFNQTLCIGSNIQDLSISGYTGHVLHWESSINNGTTWQTIANNTYTLSANNIDSLTQTTQFRALLQNGTCHSIYTNTATVTISGNQAPSAPVVNSPQYVCYNSNYNIYVPAVSSGYTYKWYIDQYNGIADSSLATVTTGSTYITRWVSLSYNGCESSRSLISIRESATPGAIATTGQTSCQLGSTPVTIGSITSGQITGGTGTVQYQWRVSVNGDNATVINGATQATYTPAAYMNSEGVYVFTRWVKNSTCFFYEKSSGQWTLIVGPPNATITSTPENGIICEGVTVQLTLASSNPSTRYYYQWYKNGDSIPNATAQTYVAGTIGTYTAKVTHRTSGCSASTPDSLATIVRYSGSAPSISGTIPVTILEACNSANINSWLPPQTTVIGMENSFELQISDMVTPDNQLIVTNQLVSSTGFHPIIVTRRYFITNQCGNQDSIDHIIQITDTVAPVIATSISNQPALYGGSNCVYKIPNVMNFVHALSSDNCTDSLHLILTQTPDSNTLIYHDTIVTITVTDASGNYTQTTVGIIVPPNLTLVATDSNQARCYQEPGGSATVVSQKGLAPVSYLWDQGDTTPTATHLSAGVHTVTVTDANGCKASTQVTIHQPESLSAQANAVALAVCPDGTISLNGSANGGSGHYEFLWKNDSAANLGNSTNINLNATDYTIGVHQFYFSVIDSICGSVRDTVEITLQSWASINNSSVLLKRGDTLNVCFNTPLTLTAYPGNAISYNWSYNSSSTKQGSFIGGNFNHSSVKTNGIDFSNEGWYRVTVVQQGCSSTDSVFVKVVGNQGRPSFTFETYYGNILDSSAVYPPNSTQILQNPDSLRIFMSHPMNGANVTDCAVEYRFFFAEATDFTPWTLWSNRNESIEVQSNHIESGFNTIELRHLSGCQTCGETPIYRVIYYVPFSSKDIQYIRNPFDMRVCNTIDSVQLDTVYIDDFDSQNSRYEFRYLYSRDTNGVAQYYYTSPWLHLNEIGDILDSIDFVNENENEQERVPYIKHTPGVSVTKTPDGQNTLFNDLIQLDIRVATLISATPGDTTWNYIESIQTWQVIESPRFTTPISHQYSCFGENSNNTPILILATVNRAYYPENTYWSYAQYPDSNFTPMIFNGTEIESTNSTLFNYRRSSDYLSFIYTEDIALFNFVNEPDTIAIMAELKSLYSSCPSAYDTVLIYIKDRKTITLLTDNSSQTVCNEESIEAIQYEIGGGADSAAIQWSPQPPNGIIFTCTDHHIYTISGASNMAGHYQYTVSTLQGENGSDCYDSVLTGTITINPTIALSPVSSQEVCNGSRVNEISFTSNTILADSVTYTWLNSNPSIGLDSAGISGISTFTASADSAIPTSSLITVTPIYTYNNKACPGTNGTFTITVNPTASIGNKNLTVCSETSFSVSPEISDQVPINTLYNWDAPVIGGISGTTSGLLSPTITGNLTNQTASPVTVNYTVIPTSGSCNAQPFTVSVSVNPKADIRNLCTSCTICSGAFSIIPVNGNNGIVPDSTMYSWQAPVVNGIFGTTSGSDTNGIYTNLTNSTDSSIQVSYSVRPKSGNCMGNPFAINIIVNPTPTIQNVSSTICSNTEFTTIPIGTIPIGTRYSWNMPDAVSNITGYVSGSNTTHINGILINDSSLVRTVIYTVTPQFNGCTGPDFTVSVQVNPRPYINPTLQNRTVCSGELTIVQNVDGIQGIIPTGTVYSWSAPIGTGINGAGGAYNNLPNMAGYLINTTNTPQSITYQVTPSAAGCTGNSYASQVTVYPAPQIQNINTAICNNENFSILPVNGQNGIVPDNTTYSWSAPVVNGTSGETSGTEQTSIAGTLTNNTSTPVVVKYTVQPFSGAIGNCMGDTFNINVTVYDQPLMNAVSNIWACPHSPVNIPLGSEHRFAGQSFYWQNSNTSIGLSATGQGNISFTSTSLPVEETSNITAFPHYETTFGTCIGNPIHFQISVNPPIKATISDIHVCPNIGEVSLTATLNYIFNDYEATWDIPGLLEDMTHQNNASQHIDSITVIIPDTLCNQTYTAYLNIVDDIGCSATDTGKITTQNEIPQIIIPQPVLNYTLTTCPVTLPDIREQVDIRSLCQNILSIEQEPAIGSLIDTSVNLVEIIVHDACGNTVRSTPITVTFSLPQTIQIICPDDLHKILDYGECSWTYQNIGRASLDFNCEKFIDTIYSNISTPVTIHGNNALEITWTIIDILGTSRSCNQILSVEYPPCENDFVATDQEEFEYKTVRIGCNCWTQENLHSRKYSDQSFVSFAKTYHSNMYQDTVWNEENFGLLYSWYSAVKIPEGSNATPVLNSSGHVEGVCPAGWYLPGETEWQDIANLSNEELKSSNFWIYNPGSNSSLFKVHPAGFFNSSKNSFNHIMGNAYFWLYDSSTGNNSTHIDYDCSLIHNENVSRENGFSIRCVKE